MKKFILSVVMVLGVATFVNANSNCESSACCKPVAIECCQENTACCEECSECC